MIDYNIIKELGNGMFGTVYLISSNGVKYALKIEHILKKHIQYNKQSPLWREINFCKKVANKYPDYFINLIDYEIIDSCDHKQNANRDYNSKDEEQTFTELYNSDYCVKKIYTVINTTLNKIIFKLDINQLYSLIIQMFNIFNILHKYNYIHGDIHTGNIGVIETNEKYIKILGKKIPTFGYIYKLIDFGLVMNKSDVINKKELNEFKYQFTTESKFLTRFLIDTKLWDYMRDKHIKPKYHRDYAQFKKTEEYHIIKKLVNDPVDQLFLFEILNSKKHQQIILNQKVKEYFDVQLRVELIDIIFILQNNNNHKKIIKYFSSAKV